MLEYTYCTIYYLLLHTLHISVQEEGYLIGCLNSKSE